MLKSSISPYKVCSLLAAVMLLVTALLWTAAPSHAKTGQELALIAPQKTGGMPLMEALNLRRSGRDFGDKSLSEQNLSNVLWAAWGTNREDGRRTVPTARNKQNVTLYVVLTTGIWEYNATKHSLMLIKAGDFTQSFKSPTTLLYAAPIENEEVSGMHVGSMYQNVGLYTASANLINRVKMSGRNALDTVLTLPKGYKVFVIQVVGVRQ